MTATRRLWLHMVEEHGLTLTDSELHEIVLAAAPSVAELAPYGQHEQSLEFQRALCRQMERRAQDAERANLHMVRVVTFLLFAFSLAVAVAAWGWARAIAGGV